MLGKFGPDLGFVFVVCSHFGGAGGDINITLLSENSETLACSEAGLRRGFRTLPLASEHRTDGSAAGVMRRHSARFAPLLLGWSRKPEFSGSSRSSAGSIL